MSYINYECTICRRTKSIAVDNQRVMPDQCVITKGCLGRLVKVGDAATLKNTPALAGVDDWYPRGEVRAVAQQANTSEEFSLATSLTGSIVIAVEGDSSLPNQMQVTLEQKRVGDVGFQQYSFKVTAQMSNEVSTTISGKDSTGKNLRFDQLAIDEDRVIVRKNGVDTSATLTPNTVTFSTVLPVGTTIDVVVFLEKSIVSRTLTLTRNSTLIPTLTRGAWSNIDYVERFDNGVVTRWYLYSIDLITNLTAGKIRIVSNSISMDAVLLLASPPYQSTDRYLNFVVEQAALADDFNTTHSGGTLTASEALVLEIYPPFTLNVDAYLSSDLYTIDNNSEIVTDTDQSRFASKKILGPV